MDNFAKLSPQDKKAYFETAAAKAGIFRAHIIEKDFWVCWTLKRLFTMPNLNNHIIFKGGTSLSKAFQIIGRFSEDIDISLSKEKFGFIGDRDPEKGNSASEKNKRIVALKEACSIFVKTDLLNDLKSSMSSILDTNTKWKLEIDSNDVDGQTLLFEYPTITRQETTYVRPLVKIELGARSDLWPAHTHNIRTYLTDYIPEVLKDSVVYVKTLDAERTFWEKATILIEGCTTTSRPACDTKVSKTYIEKDYWVVWMLERLFALDDLKSHLTFKGGTSLSKVYGIIDRFSEDIDVSIERDFLGFYKNNDPENATSKKKQRAALENLSKACSGYVQNKISRRRGFGTSTQR